MRRVLVVGDGGNATFLVEALADHGMEAETHLRPKSIAVNKVLRQIHYLRLAALLMVKRSKFDEILIWQQYVGIYYSLMDAAFPFARRPFSVYYVIYAGTDGLIGKTKWAVFVFMSRRPNLKKLFFMHSGDRLLAVTDKRRAVVFSDSFKYSQVIEDGGPRHEEADVPYLFAGGASNRDYGLLCKVAADLPEESFVVACAASNVGQLDRGVSNVRVYVDVESGRFDRLMLDARAVIVPLKQKDVIAGQLVILQAFQAGKAVFVSLNDGVAEWLKSDGVTFVFTFDTQEELAALIRSTSPDALEKAGRAGRAFYQQYISAKIFYSRLVQHLV